MKRLSILSACGGVLLIVMCFFTGKAMAQAGDVVVHTATVDVTHIAGTEPVDQIDMTASFTNNELKEVGKCEPADSVLLHGIKVTVQQGLCGATSRKANMTLPHFNPLYPGSNLAVFEGLTLQGASANAVLRTLKRLPGTCASHSLRLEDSRAGRLKLRVSWIN